MSKPSVKCACARVFSWAVFALFDACSKQILTMDQSVASAENIKGWRDALQGYAILSILGKEVSSAHLAEGKGNEIAEDHNQHKVREMPAVGVEAGHGVHQGAVQGCREHRQRHLFRFAIVKQGVTEK